jgi:serine/threonine protein kinase
MTFSLKDFNDIRKINAGGMGNVFLATQASLGRKVVIKELSLRLLKDPALVAKFKNEARAAAALGHDSIIKVFDFGTENNSFYIVMEHIDGWSLEQLFGWQPFPKEIGFIILLKALKGLHNAHERGIVHCDLKPGNILVSKTGTVKVVDFGLAHILTYGSALTDTGSVFISPRYMPPEVASGAKTPDITTDLWSAGVIAYQIASGVLPFSGDTVGDVAFSIINNKERDIREHCPTLPLSCAATIHSCLQKDPAKRPPSLGVMIYALTEYFYELGVRDIETLLEVYLKDKEAVSADVNGLVARYLKQRGDGAVDLAFPPGGVASDAYGGEPDRTGVPDKDSTREYPPEPNAAAENRPASSPGGHTGQISRRPVPKTREKTNPVVLFFADLPRWQLIAGTAGILFAVVLAAAAVFIIVKERNASYISNLREYQKVFMTPAPQPAQPHEVPGEARPVPQPAQPSAAAVEARPVPQPAQSFQKKNTPASMNQVPEKPRHEPRLFAKAAAPQPAAVPDRSEDNDRFGTAVLTISQTDAQVFIDGKNVPLDEMLAGKQLKPGVHIFAANARGYKSYSTILPIEAGDRKEFAVILKPEEGEGFLHVFSYPWTDIYIDGDKQGTAPTQNPLSLHAGTHAVTLKRDGYKTYAETVHVAKGEVARIQAKLEPDR